MACPLHVLDRAVRHHVPEGARVLSFLLVGLLNYLAQLLQVLRMDAAPHRFAIGKALLRVKARDSESFRGPVEKGAVRYIGPTARFGQPLRFCQISFAAAQGFFGPLCPRNVRHGTDKLELAKSVRPGPTGNTDVLDRTIRQQQSMLKAYILPILRRTLDFPLHKGNIFRMGPLQNKFHIRLHAWVAFEDAKGFLRPTDFPGLNIPTEAAGVAHSLPFGQVSFTAAQSFFGPLSVRDIANRAGNQHAVLGFERAEADLPRKLTSILAQAK